MERMAIGVFTSAGAGLGAGLDSVKEIGVSNVQLHCPPQDLRAPEKVAELKQAFADAGVTITTVFCGFEGESYESIPIVQETVGLVPAATRATRFKETLEIVDFAHAMGVDTVAAHIGFVPEEPDDPTYKEVVEIVQKVCDHCKANGQGFNLETGQESAEALLRFIQDVGRDNLGVNFDPANMILYGSGEPIAALKVVGQYVRGVHCKDATWTTVEGEWGEEVPLGQGDVGMANFVNTLKELGYQGPLTIEREITGDQQKEDIKAAVELLKTLR